jgi:hypothetical protein
MRKWPLGVLAGLLLGTMASLGAQSGGPYSAQIQRALANFKATAQTFGGTQTFNNLTVTGAFAPAPGQFSIQWTNGYFGVIANGLFDLSDGAGTQDVQFSTGATPVTVTTCGTGAVTAHSTNTAGEITPTGATACSVVFGAPVFTNQPFCTITAEAATVTDYISAVATTGFTVSGLASGEKFMYTCLGGI